MSISRQTLSVVIVTFKSDQVIDDCIQSIPEQTKIIIIEKTGIGNQIFKFAQNQPSFYGILCIIFAVISGIIAATAFRRL